MSRTTDESNNKMISNYQVESPSTDEGSCGGSFSGGTVLKKGPWTSSEDEILVDYVRKHGEGNWNAVQKLTGLSRCGKSCRLRWANHLRPDLKKGAFTPEEEQTIVELHATMGNKWAKMASRLEGRTDNEIKNYWNTRIKRRQRAGLPLYPPDMCLPLLGENHQCASEYSAGDKLQDGQLQSDTLPEVIFGNYKAHQAMPFSDISMSSMMNQGLGSQNYAFMTPRNNLVKRRRESETLFPRFHGSWGLPSQEQFQSDTSERILRPYGFGFPYDPDPGTKKMAPFSGAFLGSHALLNGKFSTSHPHSGTEKLELPSLQYPGSDLNNLIVGPAPLVSNSNVESPLATASMQAEWVSPENSGLLEDILRESQAMESAMNQPSEKNSFTSNATAGDFKASAAMNFCCTDLKGCKDPNSPLGLPAASILSESPPPTSFISLEEAPLENAITGLNIKLEPIEHVPNPNSDEEKTTPVDSSLLDALRHSSQCYNGSLESIDHLFCDDSLGTLLSTFHWQYA